MLKQSVKEPLVHFFALGLVIFLVYGLLNPSVTEKRDRIIITASKIEQIGMLFTKTWQRPPTVAELKALIDDYVKEEILVREALALGLDKDDTVFRRRLRLKMEFLSDAETETLLPTDAELDAYLKANPDKFEIDPMFAFRQVYLNPERRGERVDQDAASILEVLLTKESIDPATLGDVTLLPPELPLTGKASIGQTFGPEFAEGLAGTKAGHWSGPIKSSFGFHLVQVLQHTAGRIPALDEVRGAVTREWASEQRRAMQDARFTELLKRYQIIIESPPGTAVAR